MDIGVKIAYNRKPRNIFITKVLLLVGNKCDLKEQTVSVDEAANFAR